MIKVKVYAILREKLGWSEKIININHEISLKDLINNIEDLRKYLINENGKINEGYIVLVNGINIHFLNGLNTIVKPNDEIHIFPPGGGG